MTEGISRDTFEKMDTDSKLNVLFDYMEDVRNCMRWRTTIYLAAASITGFVGGICAHLGEKLGLF